MMKTKKSAVHSRESILNDLENLYQEALAQENLSVALKVKELQVKELGLFHAQKKPTIDWEALTDDELKNMIVQLEALCSI